MPAEPDEPEPDEVPAEDADLVAYLDGEADADAARRVEKEIAGSPEVRSEAEAGSGLTRQLDSKTVLGTADYVAPEQVVDSSSVDIRADVYSLGATLYFALTGRTLFPEGRVTQKLVWQQIREPTPVDRLRPAVPPELAAVVHRMLAKRRGW